MKKFATAVVLASVLCCPSFAQKVVSQIAAKVNKDIILVSEVKKADEEMRSELAAADTKLTKSQLTQLMEEQSKNILRDLIDKYLVLQQASDMGLDANLEVLKQIEQLRVENGFPTMEALEAAMARQGLLIEDVKDNIRYKNLRAQVLRREVTGKIVITTEEMRAYYDDHKGQFDRPAGISIGMISMATDGLSPTEIEAKRKLMETALAALKKGDNFSEVAIKNSEDPSAQDGGVLPFFERNADGGYGLSQELEDVVVKLNKGQITDILTNSQNHTLIILKLLDRHDGGVLPYDIAQNEIYSALLDVRAEPKVRDYLTRLRAEGFVEVSVGFTDTGAATKAVRASDTTPPKP